jgi:hypothetical protein
VLEEEAKTKWCPYARTGQGNAPVNRKQGERGEPDPDCLCLGARCMAWRWAYDMAEGDTGFCGLAGREGAP